MNNYQYDKPLRVSYHFPAALVTTAGVVGALQGPEGRKGRIVELSYSVEVDTNDVAEITLDTNAGLTTPLALAVANAPGVNACAVATRASIEATSELPADTVVELQVTVDTTTAGSVNVTAVVEWY